MKQSESIGEVFSLLLLTFLIVTLYNNLRIFGHLPHSLLRKGQRILLDFSYVSERPPARGWLSFAPFERFLDVPLPSRKKQLYPSNDQCMCATVAMSYSWYIKSLQVDHKRPFHESFTKKIRSTYRHKI